MQIGDENVHRVRALMDEVFDAGTEKRAAIFIGPEFGTVSRPEISNFLIGLPPIGKSISGRTGWITIPYDREVCDWCQPKSSLLIGNRITLQ